MFIGYNLCINVINIVLYIITVKGILRYVINHVNAIFWYYLYSKLG